MEKRIVQKDGVFFQKDLYITREMKEKLIDFLSEKTGLEWYAFRKKSDIFESLKSYIIETINCFDELDISFEDLNNYCTVVDSCFLRNIRNERFYFKFTEEEYKTISDFCYRRGYQQKTVVLYIILCYFVNQKNTKLTVKLNSFTDFFLCKNYSTNLSVPGELLASFKTCKDPSFGNNYKLFLKKAFFYQITWDKIPLLKNNDEEYFRVTPQKTGWTFLSFSSSYDVKKYITDKNYGSTVSVVILNAVNSYVKYANKVLK